jgi:predicted DNA-binding WGR domain protein
VNTILQNNKIGHSREGTSDKIYIVGIRHLPSGKWQVLGKWGRRHCRTMQLEVKGEYDILQSAQDKMRDLFHEKLRKGYQDIQYPNYPGGVTVAEVRSHLEDDPAFTSSVQTSVQTNDVDVSRVYDNETKQEEKEKYRKRSGQKMRVKCINNLGYEGQLVLGEEYPAMTTHDPEMILVTTESGCAGIEVFAERFEVL